MKKIKKVLALLVAMVMVMGMTVTTMAAENKLTSSITVKGLTEGAKTKLDAYQAVSYDKTQNNWVIADWAKKYIIPNTDGKSYIIENAVELGKVAQAQTPTYTEKTTAQEHVFNNVNIGAYVILASDDKETVYTTMVAETYKDNATYIEAEDKTIFAKADKVKLDKKADDKFIDRGQQVTFTITTTFPNFENPELKSNSFKIVDTPTGLDIEKVTSLTIGGEENQSYKTSKKENGEFTIDLTPAIGTTNVNAGKTVVVTYTAVVTAENGYSNTANAFKNNEEYGKDDEVGYTGDITLTKYASDGDNDKLDNNDKLAGAKFKVHKENKEGEVLSFVLINENIKGVYRQALANEEGVTQELEVSSEGVLQVKGLAEGRYFFEETKAPEGYSINEKGATVEIKANEKQNVSVSDNVIDTKLSSLPSTGGIGTTIFTIGGCVIMIVAAGLFFASRRKENK